MLEFLRKFQRKKTLRKYKRKKKKELVNFKTTWLTESGYNSIKLIAEVESSSMKEIVDGIITSGTQIYLDNFLSLRQAMINEKRYLDIKVRDDKTWREVERKWALLRKYLLNTGKYTEEQLKAFDI